MAASNPEPGAPPLLAARDLHVRVGDQSLLRGASFQLDPGELVVLLGALIDT